MKIWKKISIFVILSLVLCMALGTVAYATEIQTDEAVTEAEGKLPMELGGKDNPLDFDQRLEYALQGTVTGMVMVFAVLGLLAVIVTVSKFFLYDIPNKKKNEASKPKAPAPAAAPAPVPVSTPAPVQAASVASAHDDGELAAVITAAIAAMIESGDYKNEFVNGFRVVSFKRSTKSAWNKK